jgi:hypothetical protein
MSTTEHYNTQQLRQRFDGICASATALCRLTREMCGGQPADKAGLEAFVRYQLKLAGEQEIAEAVERIQKEELGERDVTPEGGEIKERMTYGVCALRKSQFGPWIGDWMIKACLKAAISRLELFQKLRCKGDVAELGLVEAVGSSLQGEPYQVHLYQPVGDEGSIPPEVFFQKFHGSVSTPQGKKSIVTDHECVKAGAYFQFRVQWKPTKLKGSHMADAFAVFGNIGLGSVKAMERGKFEVVSLEIEE